VGDALGIDVIEVVRLFEPIVVYDMALDSAGPVDTRSFIATKCPFSADSALSPSHVKSGVIESTTKVRISSPPPGFVVRLAASPIFLTRFPRAFFEGPAGIVLLAAALLLDGGRVSFPCASDAWVEAHPVASMPRAPRAAGTMRRVVRKVSAFPVVVRCRLRFLAAQAVHSKTTRERYVAK
jgi:hypothetical protein